LLERLEIVLHAVRDNSSGEFDIDRSIVTFGDQSGDNGGTKGVMRTFCRKSELDTGKNAVICVIYVEHTPDIAYCPADAR
jgi:hypothetical protein